MCGEHQVRVESPPGSRGASELMVRSGCGSVSGSRVTMAWRRTTDSRAARVRSSSVTRACQSRSAMGGGRSPSVSFVMYAVGRTHIPQG